MYSGSTLTRFSGRVMGAHQKIDNVSRRHLSWLIPDEVFFPPIRLILSFEGKNGPDGIKRKSPAKDEPWHFIDPHDETDTQLLQLIEDHYNQLVLELKNGNQERAAFEAAWLAHAIVDGLTPAHHFPYEEKLGELRGGEGIETRSTLMGKLLMPGETKRQQLRNNWKMWGSKGLMMTHGMFEIGVATLIKPLTFNDIIPTKADLVKIEKLGVIEWFSRATKEIAALNMYEAYYAKGWTPRLALQVRQKLGPILVQAVTLCWYSAVVEAGLVKPAGGKK